MFGQSRRQRAFSAGGRASVIAIFLTFAIATAITLVLSLGSTDRLQNQATVVEVIARQRTLAERYVSEVLLVRAGRVADPSVTASVMARTVHALLNGGVAPEMAGDDDTYTLSPVAGTAIRRQLSEEGLLVTDLAAYGSAFLSHRPLNRVPETAGEAIILRDPLDHLRELAALTSQTALDASRSVARQADSDTMNARTLQIALQLGELLLSLLLASVLFTTTRRQSAHFRSLVTSSTDFVCVLGTRGCKYAGRSLSRLLGETESELLGGGLRTHVHEDDRATFDEVQRTAQPRVTMLRVRGASGEWRHLEAHATDLRSDRRLRGVMISARDVTERIELERELSRQAHRDAFGSQLIEALEMVDEELGAHDVVRRAMVEISADAPTELLLADSSRANLSRVVHNPGAEPPGCSVKSPFSCLAVRRGQPVSFESSGALNACPMLRDRPAGPCSAVCVPVSFMGRALGVLHTTGPEGQVATGEQIAQLTTLATQAGARIGTVRAFEKTQLQAATDSLTGLINRRTFEARVRELIGDQRPFALVVADLDHFKRINDTHGHEAGDRALRLFAQIARQDLRDGDLLARWGGEEFVFALADIDRAAAVSVLNRIRTNLADSFTGDAPRFTASFGVTDSSAASDIERLVQIADAGLYTSKQEGRDRVTIGHADPELPPRAVDEVYAAPQRGAVLRPLLHEAADEEQPRPTGLEIR